MTTGAAKRAKTRVTIVTLASTPRLNHLHNQLAGIRRLDTASVVVVWLGDDEPPELDVDEVLRVEPGRSGLRLAAARNAGADCAAASGAELIVFLDADCVPGPDLVDRYVDAAVRHPDAVLCGPVTYLEPGVDVSDRDTLFASTNPHRARPFPPAGQSLPAAEDDYNLFWSLSFAMTADAWAASPRFDERYEGYGGEDTDFGFALRNANIPLVWVGGAHAYHQHHPTSSPPWQHLDDILKNGRRFAERWGEWPMTGWLAAFEEAGAVRWDGATWLRT